MNYCKSKKPKKFSKISLDEFNKKVDETCAKQPIIKKNILPVSLWTDKKKTELLVDKVDKKQKLKTLEEEPDIDDTHLGGRFWAEYDKQDPDNHPIYSRDEFFNRLEIELLERNKWIKHVIQKINMDPKNKYYKIINHRLDVNGFHIRDVQGTFGNVFSIASGIKSPIMEQRLVERMIHDEESIEIKGNKWRPIRKNCIIWCKYSHDKMNELNSKYKKAKDNKENNGNARLSRYLSLNKGVRSTPLFSVFWINHNLDHWTTFGKVLLHEYNSRNTQFIKYYGRDITSIFNKYLPLVKGDDNVLDLINITIEFYKLREAYSIKEVLSKSQFLKRFVSPIPQTELDKFAKECMHDVPEKYKKMICKRINHD